MKKLKFLPLFLVLCLLVPLLAAVPVRAAEPELSSYAAILVDRASGSILYAKNAEEPLYPASLTKIMTVLVAVEAIENGTAGREDAVTVQAGAFADLGESPSVAGLRVGDTLSLEDLLYCAMLSSGNEACNIIAEHLSGSASAYAERMSLRARELGCSATNFVNTHGATEYLHKTTALDLARIALYASRHPLFMEICGTAERTVVTAGGRELTLHNSNALLCSDSVYGSDWLYDGASGMMTGYTVAAGYCLVATAERGGRELLAVLLRSPDSDARFRDATRLLDHGFDDPSTSSSASVSLLSGSNVLDDGFGPSLSSYSAVILDQKTGEVLFSKRADSQIFPADTAKVMTALLAVEAVEQGEVSLRADVTVSESACGGLGLDATRLLSPGEVITLENLLYCALISSSDDAANAIAEFVAGDQAAFVDRMNERAAQLGCAGTHFSNATGLHTDDNYTTAADMALIALEASRHELLSRITSTTDTELSETNVSPARTLKTTNALLVRDSVYGAGYLYERAGGIKTGYNSVAGYCLLASAADEETGIQLVAAVYGGEKTDAGYSNFSDAVTLFDWVYANYSYQEVLSPNKNIASVDVNLGMDTDYVNLRPAGSVVLLLPNNYDPNTFTLDMTVYSLQQGKIVTAPVTAGEVLGEVSVLRDGQNCGTVKLVAAANVDLSRSGYITSHIRETTHSSTFRLIVAILAVILVLYLAWVIYYRVRRLRYKSAVKKARKAAPAKTRRKAAELPQSPQIEFFDEGRGEAPEDEDYDVPEDDESVLPEAPEASELPGFVPATDDDLIPSFLDRPAEAPAPAPQPAEEPRSIPVFEDLDSAPKAEAEPAPDPFDLFKSKAEKDYFEEFFRKK